MSPSWLEARADRDPDEIALEHGAARMSFGDLRERSRRRLAALVRSGVGRGDIVATLLPNGAPFVELLHAVDALGATLLPLHLRLTVAELTYQLGDARPRLLVHGEDELAVRAADAARTPEVPLCPASELDAPPLPLGVSVAPEQALALLYTSGTTGRSKGALLSRRAFAASAAASSAVLGGRPGDRWLACLPLYHVGGLSLLTRSVIGGGPVILHERFDARAVSDGLDRGNVAGVSMVPAMLARVLDARDDQPAPASLRTVLLGGAAAPAALLDRAERAGFPVAVSYGLTEAASQVATRPAGDRSPGLPPLPGTRLRIVDDGGDSCPADRPGAIEVQSQSLMNGYLNRPEQSAAALQEGWLRTGDVGSLDANGRLHVLDRRADLIVSGGENVYPAEIERVLLEHPAVREAGVAALSDAQLGQRPMAWVVFRDEGTSDDAVLGFCRKRLAGYKVPVRLARVSSLPRNALGKLLRRELGSRMEPTGSGAR